MTAHVGVYDRSASPRGVPSIQSYARTGGLLLLISIVVGGFGEMYVPSRLVVSGDAAATAANILASGSLFRLGFAAYLVEALCDVGLTLVLYVLLSPVQRELALLAALFRIVSTATFAMAELLYYAALLVLGGARYLETFSHDQLSTIALLSAKVSAHGAAIFMSFYGVASILLGWLIFRSGYLPRLLGALLALGGLGFVLRSFALVLRPAYASSVLLLPMGLAGVTLALWLLARGVDARGWEGRTAS